MEERGWEGREGRNGRLSRDKLYGKVDIEIRYWNTAISKLERG